jgi:ATP-dependent RNA helicase RhlE
MIILIIPKKLPFSIWNTIRNIKQITYNVPNFNTKVNLLKHLLESNEDMSRVLVLLITISDMLHERIEEDFDGQFGVIHSNKSQNYRLTMASFQEGNLRGLITTDIMARGWIFLILLM